MERNAADVLWRDLGEGPDGRYVLYGRPFSSTSIDTEEIVALHRQVRDHYDQGKYADALTIAERALALAESSLGKEHPDTLNGIKNLVDIYQAQDRFDAEEPFAKRVLEARQRVLGNPDTLTSVHDLGLLYFSQRRFDEAASLDLAAVEARERVLGKEHADTLDSVNHWRTSIMPRPQRGGGASLPQGTGWPRAAIGQGPRRHP